MLRLDYSGCGVSEGLLEEGTLTQWRDDVLFLIDSLVEGPFVLIGSSMGGWLALLVARARPERLSALIGIRSEEHTSELQSLMRSSYAVFCLKKKNKRHQMTNK